MKNNLKSVTIGIPALNEEKNIAFIIRSLFSQKRNNFRLTNITVSLDGSTDNTYREVKKLMKSYKKLVIINNKERKGKSTRLTEFFRKNKSDIFVLIDADIFIEDDTFLEKIIAPFSDPATGLVSANHLPMKTDEFWGRVWGAAELIWYHARKNSNRGNNMYNASGASFAVEKNFAKKIKLPMNTIDEWRVIFGNTLLQKKLFVFARNAITRYLPPATFEDIKKLHARSSEDTDHILKNFLLKHPKYTKVSRKNIILGTIESFINDPFYSLFAIILLRILPFLKINQNHIAINGMWETIATSKKGFPIQYEK